MIPMHTAVAQAVVEIEAAFPDHRVEHVPDGEGGAFVRVHELPLGDAYLPCSGWVTFRITHAYPHADIYPHYLPDGLQRRDGKALGEGFHKQQMQLGPFTGAATMVSRKSYRWNPAHDTAAIKLAKLLDWIRTRL